MENSSETDGQKTETAVNCVLLLGFWAKVGEVVGEDGMALARPGEPVEADQRSARRRVHASIYVRAGEAGAGRGGPI